MIECVCVWVKDRTLQVDRPREDQGQQSLWEMWSHWRAKFKKDGAARARREGQVGRAVVDRDTEK